MNAILEQINSAGLRFVEFALPMSVQSGVLILILLLTDFALRKKVRAVFRYWIWMLVLVKLILPTSLSAPMSLGYFFGDKLAYVNMNQPATEAEPKEPAPAIVPLTIDLTNIQADKFTPTQAPIIPATGPVVTEPAQPPAESVTPLSWQGAVFLLWLAVVPAMGLLLLQRAMFVRGLVTQAKEANDSVAEMLESCRERVRVKRKIGLRVSSNAASPAVCGLFRPVILVPKNLASNLNSGQLRAVLLHELAHIRRGDLWVNLAQTFLQIIYFYNPLLWLANSVIRRVREQAVDEMVLVAMGEKAQQYPQTLVDVAKLAFKRPALSLRLIGVVESKSALAGRIKHILNRPMPKKAKLGILGLAVVIVTAAILLPMATCTPGPPSLVIKGMVKDAQTGKPIAGARVFDDGYGPEPNWEQIKANVRSEWGAITNSAGEYSFLTWPEHHSIKVEAPGYKDKRESLYDGHFVFNKKDEEIFDFALEPEKVLDSSGFKRTLPNGVTVELVCICEHPSEGKQWWRPDGSILEPDHAPSDHSRMTVKPDETEQARELALRFAGLDVEQMSFRWEIDMATRSSSHPFYVTEKREKLKPLRNIVFKLPQNLETLDFSIGVATGEWKRVASGGDGRTVSGTNDSLTDSSVIFHEAVKENDTVRLCATHLLGGDYDCRIVVVDRDDEIHEPIRSSNSGSDMRLCKGFFDLSPVQIKYIMLQARPYEWITFKNVSLRPEVKTDVQVEIEPEKPAGQVQGEGGAPKQLSSGGGYQNLSREQRERLERRQANRQSLSYKNMQKLGLAVAVFANDHKGRCPLNLSDLRKYIADEQIFNWINRNVVYLGKNQQYRAPPDAVLAYDESMLKKPPKETNVLYNDAHVSFEKSEWLEEQGIIVEQKPPGVELNEKSINSDSKVKVGGIVQVEDKPVVGEWEDISKAIPADCNETILLAEHITLDSIGQDVEGKTFITLLRDRVKTKNQQYRFILVRLNGRVVEPAGYKTLVFGDQLWERFSFDMPYHHRQIKEFRLQRFPQNLERKASLPVVNPYDPGVNGKIAARATSAPPGRGALHFDGQGDYLYVPDSQSLWMKTPFTVEIWVKPEFPKEELENWPSWGLISKGCTIGTGRVKLRGFGITLNRFKDDPNLLMVDYSTADDNGIYSKSYGRSDFDYWIHLYHVFSHERYEPGHGYPLVIGKFLIPESPFAGQIGEIRIWSGARSRDQIAQYRNKPLTGDESDLVACWTFEQSGGQIAYDISTHRNHARLGTTTDADDADPTWVTVTGGSTIDKEPGNETDDQVLARSTVGPVGKHALSFDGVDDYLHVAANSTLTLKPPFTIEMWLKPDYSDIPRTKASEKLWPFLSLLRKGKRLFFQERKIQAGGFMMFAGPSSQPDWKCSAGLYLGNEKGLMYQVDGFYGDRLQPAQPGWLYVSMSCTRETYIPVPDQPLITGQNILPVGGFPFKGDIAEIRIWAGVSSRDQIARYRNKPLNGNEPGLVACWDFKRPGGQVVYDIGPNGNHARLGGSEGPDDADPKWVDIKITSDLPGQKTNMQVKDTKIAPGSSGEAVDSSELTGRVVDENGNTVADAQVAISTEKIGVLVASGKLQPIRSGVESRIVQTDSQGIFDFGQKPDEDFDLIVAHEKGFAMVESEEFVASGEIHLQTWGHIDGQLAEGRKAAGNKIWMSSLPNPTWFRHKREYRDETKCDESGHFVFDKVPPGWFEVGYLTRSGKNSWSITSRTPVVVKTGQTTKMRLGGEGRPVTGRFVPPEGYDKSIYFGEGSRSLLTVRPEEPRPDNYDRMTKQQQRQWREQWRKMDEYKKYRDDYWHNPDWRQYTFFIEKDGSFRIDDVIAGKYQLSVWIEERHTGQGRPEEIAGYYGTIEVPEMPGGRSDEPLDLGDLELTMHNPLRVGDIAPLFEAKTLNGKDLKLIDYRGKFVLLSFWQPVFHPEKQQLQELYDTYGSDGQLKIIGLGGNDTLEEVKNYVEENAIPWPQIFTGEKFKSGIAKDYGGFGIFLIDPDGRIIAKDLRGEKLKSVVSEAIEVANVNKPDVQVEVGSNAPISEAGKENKKPPEPNEPSYDGRSLTEIIAALSDQDFQARINAVYHLGYMGPKAKPAVPALVGALDEERLRESVLHSLGNIGVGAEDAIPALIKAIAEYAPACRWMAAESLAKIGNAAVPALKKAAGSEEIYLRIWCNAALAKQQGTDSPSLRYLAQLMKNADKRTAGEAVSALTMLGPISKPLVPDLIEALKHSVVSKRHIASALAQIGKDAGPAVPELTKMLQDADLWTRADVISALSRIGGPDVATAVPLLIQALKTNDTSNTVMASRVRYKAATALGNVGPDARPAIPALVIALGDKDEFVRANSAKAIGDIDPTDLQAVPALLEAMKDESGRVRVAAAQTLLKIGPVNKKVILAFIGAVDDNWKYVMYACDDFFSYLGPQHSYIVPELIKMLKKPDERSKRLAITALINIGSEAPAAIPYILECINNPNLEVWAFAAIPKLSANPEKIVPLLVDMLSQRGIGSLTRRTLAADALGKIGSSASGAIPSLEDCLGLEGDPDTVGFARALLEIDPKNAKAIRELEAIAESPYVTKQWTEQPDAHYLLIKYGHEANRHIQALIDALENPNSRIRLSVAAYLGKLGAKANDAAESLGRALKDDYPQVRAEAAHAILLISLKPSERKEACNILFDLLDGKDFAGHDGLFMAQVRAAEALLSFGPLEEWTIPLLVAKVQDGSMRTRVAAIKAFGNIGQGAKEAIPYLKRLLKNEDWQIRHSAAQAIEKIDNKHNV